MKDVCKTCKKEFKHKCHAHRKYCSLNCQKNGDWYKEMKKLHVGKSSWNKGKLAPWVIVPTPKYGIDNSKWKGDDVGYDALHRWVQRYFGKAKECVYCGSETNVQWASVSHKAKRDLNDYISLCQSCHAQYDDYVRKSWKNRKQNGRGWVLLQM